MVIDKIDKNLDVVDSVLTKTGKILKKHWFIIILLLFSWFIYWSLTTEFYDEEYYDYYEQNENYEQQLNIKQYEKR